MSVLAAILFLVLGLIVGGVLNHVATRLPDKEAAFWSPPRCERCGQRLELKERVPLLSYLLQRGRHRHCGGEIPVRQPVIEAVSGLGSFGLALWLFPRPGLYVLLLLLYIGVAATAIDMQHRIIPNRLLIAGAVVIALALAVTGPGQLLGAVEGGALLFVLALILAIAGRGGFGLGDVKYLALVGFALGPVLGIVALFAAVFLGGLYAASLLVRRRAGRRDTIAFGPFIAAASILAPVLVAAIPALHTNI